MRLLLPVLSVLFFVSGASALIYQTLWLRLLGLVFGVTVHAASTVFASFMTGLAIGSYAAGRLAPRIRRPLLWFAAAEALIAITAVSTPGTLRILQAAYVAVHPIVPESLAALTAVRFLIAFAVLVLPTVLMGATLPLVMKSSLMNGGGAGSRFGVLYAANTAGAIAGTLAAGLALIPQYGIQQTFVVAALANVLVAVVAVAIGRRPAAPAAERRAADLAGGPQPFAPAPAPAVRRVVLAAFILSGFTSLALEVLWFRVNVLVLRPTVYAFAIMLATLLGGIALGSAVVAPVLARRWRWVPILAALELLLAAAGLASFRALQGASALTERWSALSAVMPPYLVPLVVTSAVTILPAAFLLGVAFPIGLQLWTDRGSDAGTATRRIGIFYSLNVCGGIAGSIAAGFVLLPWLGSRTTLIVITSITAAMALALLAVDRSTRILPRALLAVAGVALLGAMPVPDPFAILLQQRFPHQPIVWREEGVQTTVSVHRFSHQHVMYLDGLHQASTAPSLVATHRRIGHLGMALHPNPRRALVVGLGGGATAGAVSQYPSASVDVVELSRAVVKGAAFFSGINYALLEKPNVRVHVDDGRNHLMLRRSRYDVVTADIIQPIHAGAGNVYSEEYFRLVRSALSDNGLAVQWVWGTDAEYKMIMRTFLSVFPNATLWADGSVMVASRRRLQISRGDIAAKLHVAETRDALAAAGFGSVDQLLQSYTAGPAEMKRFVGPGPILTDNRPAIEYFLSLPREPLEAGSLRGDVRAIVGE